MPNSSIARTNKDIQPLLVGYIVSGVLVSVTMEPARHFIPAPTALLRAEAVSLATE